MQTIATVSTCATLLIGFTLKVDRRMPGAEQAGEYDNAIIDIILILLFSGVGISGLYMTLKSLPCFAGADKKEENKDEKRPVTAGADTKEGGKDEKGSVTSDEIKNWSLSSEIAL
jgi:hypothetical protein